MNKTIKYLKFTLFAMFITMMIGVVGVEAKSCVYDYEYETALPMGAEGIFNAKYHTHVEFSIGTDEKAMIFSKEDSYIQLTEANWNGDKEATLTEEEKKQYHTIKHKGTFERGGAGTCSAIYIDVSDNKPTVYANESDCKKGWFGGGCNKKNLHKLEGTIKYNKNEKEECSQEKTEEQTKKYHTETLRFYGAGEPSQLLATYQIKIMNAITLQTSTDTIERNIKNVFSELEKYYETLQDGIVKTWQKYTCVPKETKDMDIENIKRQHSNVQAGLESYAEEQLQKEKDRWEKEGRDTTGFDKILENIKEHLDNLRDKLETATEKSKELNIPGIGTTLSPNCSNILGDAVDIVQQIFDWVKIIAPVMLILFGSIDYAKAVIANDNDALKKATNNFVKRAIAAVAIFFLPFIINLILSLPGIKETIEMGDDPLCGVSKVVIK